MWRMIQPHQIGCLPLVAGEVIAWFTFLLVRGTMGFRSKWEEFLWAVGAAAAGLLIALALSRLGPRTPPS